MGHHNGARTVRAGKQERLISTIAPHHKEACSDGLCLATAVLQGVSLTWMGTPGSHSSSANQKTPPSILALCVPLYKVGRALGVKTTSEMWQGLPSRNKTHQRKLICNQAQASNHTGHLKRSILQSLYPWPLTHLLRAPTELSADFLTSLLLPPSWGVWRPRSSPSL